MKTRRQQIAETVNYILEAGLSKGIRFRNLPLLDQEKLIAARNAQLAADVANLHDIRAFGTDIHPVLRAAQEDEVIRRAARKLIQGERIAARIGERIGDAYYDPSVLPSPR